jgi:glycosyltransferase involved in cell wall biosynthesis
MTKNDRPLVLFETEGSYPYSGGGVSTWAHILCLELNSKIDFCLYAITGNPFVEPKYKLSDNIKRIIHIPLWGVEEPVEYFDSYNKFSNHINRKSRTDRKGIKKQFVPLFEEFLDCLFHPYSDVQRVSELIYGMWKYFQYYDFKITLKEPLLWNVFKSYIDEHYIEEKEKGTLNEEPRVFDITFGMRWFYHFLMPLAVPVPANIDVAHATIAGFPGIASIVAKYEYGTPSVVTDHGVYIRERLINLGQSDLPYFSKKLLVNLSILISRSVYYCADQISPVTNAHRKWEERFEAEPDKIKPIYNGVDANLFVPAPKPPKTEKIPTVIAVAHVFPLKDIETMIRTCDLVRNDIKNVQFVVYGSIDVDPDYVEKCEKLIKELDVADHFEFGGFHNEPSKIFTEGDISILTSISEGFPYTVLESMSCGRPVVATDVGGVRDALEGCGILCKPRDPVSIANGVIKLLNDDDLRIELGLKGREKVLLNFTTKISVDAYSETYTSLASLPRKPFKEAITNESVKQALKHLEEEYELVS